LNVIRDYLKEYWVVIDKNIDYDKWYCGHYHTEKETDKVEFMFQKVKKLQK